MITQRSPPDRKQGRAGSHGDSKAEGLEDFKAVWDSLQRSDLVLASSLSTLASLILALAFGMSGSVTRVTTF